jgi:hypothetical protein
MTLDQKKLVRERFRIDTQLFIDIMTWFVQKSGHPGFKDTSIPEQHPQPLLVEDLETKNTTNDSANINVESNYGETYYFSSAQDPSENISV